MASMSACFPDRPIVDIDNSDAIFHTIYDLDDRYQVPGAQLLYRAHQIYENDGYDAALARHLRRQGPPDGGHLPQHGPGRFLGARRQSRVPGEILGAGHPDRRELHRLCDDPLVLFSNFAKHRSHSARYRTATVRESVPFGSGYAVWENRLAGGSACPTLAQVGQALPPANRRLQRTRALNRLIPPRESGPDARSL